jgi:hypothetical protein
VCVCSSVYIVTYFTARIVGNAKFHSSVNLSLSSRRPQRVLNNDLWYVLMDDIRGTICCVMLTVLPVVCGFRGFDPTSFHADLWWTCWLSSECLSQILLPRSFVLHWPRIITLLWNGVPQSLSYRLDIHLIPWTKDPPGIGVRGTK